MTIISNKGKQRVRSFIAKAQSHLQWLRVQKWNLEQEIKKVENNSQYQNTCDAVSQRLSAILKQLIS